MTKKIILLLASVLIVSALWLSGLQNVYARVLVFSTNTVLDMGGRYSHIKVAEDKGDGIFHVFTIVDDTKVNFRQSFQTLLYPTIIVLAWHLFTVFVLGWRTSLRSAKWNIPLFILFQVIFLLLLTAYYSSQVARFIYTMMMEGFYVIAIIIVIIDSIRHPEIIKRPKEIRT